MSDPTKHPYRDPPGPAERPCWPDALMCLVGLFAFALSIAVILTHGAPAP